MKGILHMYSTLPYKINKEQTFGNILTSALLFSKISCASNFKGPQYTPDFADKYFWIAW